ncbi:hypothetical protein Trco_004991 [Trichoderma cornu-damae]|uniref:Aminoglycoside phosphotransferase domain-containing protein n=1 Tax=Trichoderma cornu-damae TaxID=654480 RepID=A0A9P8QML7_9HYPO|nr:hypothetical protein Trco_004991 [Trichoderma cornu-damae]
MHVAFGSQQAAAFYSLWTEPRRFQDDPTFPGRIFAQQKRLSRDHGSTEKPLEETGPLLATIDPDAAPEMGKRNVVFIMSECCGAVSMARLHNPLIQRSTIADPQARLADERRLLESEIATMQYVRTNSRIPVPEVYDFDSGYDNELGVPYAILECMPGKPFPFPFKDRGFVSDAELARIHSQLVNFQWQLLQLPFDAIGQLCLDPAGGDPCRLGPIVDRKLRTYGPFDDSRQFYAERAKVVLSDEQRTVETFSSSSQGEIHFSEARSRARSVKLHLAGPACLGETRFDRGAFFLQHADMHWQNILLDDSCTVVGVLDWEWSHTVPYQGFRPLPLNLATKLRPKLDAVVAAHERIALHIFRCLLGEDEVSSCSHGSLCQLVNSPEYALRRAITTCLDAYNWPQVRQEHYEYLESCLRRLSALKGKDASADMAPS